MRQATLCGDAAFSYDVERWLGGRATQGARELSRRSGVSLGTINCMANNLTAQVSLKTLDALARELGVQPGDIIEGDEPPKRGRGK